MDDPERFRIPLLVGHRGAARLLRASPVATYDGRHTPALWRANALGPDTGDTS